MSVLVILVGQAGVGKTTIRDPLAERLGAEPVGPDDFPNRWDDIYWRLDKHPCVLECCIIPRAVRKRLTGNETIVELVASEDVRRTRLGLKGLDAATVEIRVGQSSGTLGYQDVIVPDLRIDTSDEPEKIVDQIVGFVNAKPMSGIRRTSVYDLRRAEV